MSIRLTDEALADIAGARRWYRQQRPELAGRFMQAVTAGLQLIEAYPEGQRPVYGSTRRQLLSGFPYALFYFIEGEMLIVNGCFHTARDPRVWQERSDAALD